MNNRVNIYGFPHKGLRYALGQLSVKAGAVNVSNSSEIKELVALTEEISELLDLHLKAEEQFVLPPLEAKVPGSTTSNHEDHIKMERLEKEMVTKAHKLSETRNMQLANEFYNHVNLYIREYFRHMNEEENDINEVLWNHFEDQELLGWQGQILAELTPEQFFKWFKFIIPALSPEEQNIMLGGFKQNAPNEIYASTIDRLKPFLTQNQIAHVSTV